ncbi:MAG: hypothetical protein R3F61_13325 [Myxococcota bacterium]
MAEVEELQREVRALRSEMERERRRTRFVALAAMVVVLAGASLPPTDLLRAKRLEIGEGTPGIVLTHGPDGPSITLSNGDDRTTRLTLAGLELSTVVAQPSSKPTLTDPGLGESPPPEVGRPVTVDVGKDVYVSHLEVVCSTGFRSRATFHEGRAVLQLPPDHSNCTALFGGGTTAMRQSVMPGDQLQCKPRGNGGTLACTKVSPP